MSSLDPFFGMVEKQQVTTVKLCWQQLPPTQSPRTSRTAKKAKQVETPSILWYATWTSIVHESLHHCVISSIVWSLSADTNANWNAFNFVCMQHGQPLSINSCIRELLYYRAVSFSKYYEPSCDYFHTWRKQNYVFIVSFVCLLYYCRAKAQLFWGNCSKMALKLKWLNRLKIAYWRKNDIQEEAKERNRQKDEKKEKAGK